MTAQYSSIVPSTATRNPLGYMSYCRLGCRVKLSKLAAHLHTYRGSWPARNQTTHVWRMRSIMETTIDSTTQARWDLSILYSNIDDPRLDSDLSDLAAMAKHFSLAYKGKLSELLGPAIRDFSEIEMLSGKISSYLFLRESTDLYKAALNAKHAAVQ